MSGRALLDLVRRVARLEAALTTGLEAHDHGHVYGVHNDSYIAALSNASIAANATVTTADLRGAFGVPAYARGIVLALRGTADKAGDTLWCESADETPDAFSPQVVAQAAAVAAGCVLVRVGLSGSNAGKVKVKADGTGNWTGVYGAVVGYWI